MKQYLRDILFTLLFGIAVVIPIEVVYNHQDNMMGYKYSYLETHPDRIKTLNLGHSQASVGIDPQIIGDSTFNAAVSGRIIYYDLILMRKYIDRMPNLQTVIYPMHYTFSGGCRFYNDDNSHRSNIFEHGHFLHLYNDRYPVKSLLSHSAFLSGQLTSKAFGKSKEVYDSLGHVRLDGTSDNFAQDLVTQDRQEEFTHDLTDLALLCKEHGVRLIVITPPFHSRATRETTPTGMNNLYQTIASVQKTSPVEYHNYLADSLVFTDSLFFDATHLNHTGATLFSHHIKEDFSL